MLPLVIDASAYQVVPNTEQDMAQKICSLIASSDPNLDTVIQLQAGTYILQNSHDNAMLVFETCNGVTLRGTVDAAGVPTTRLLLRTPLKNDATAQGFVAVRNSKRIRFENLIFDYENRFSSAGQVIETDEGKDRVVVDVFQGQSHFDGMKCYSANSWNLDTRELNPVEPLTIGIDQSVFAHTWKRIPGGAGRRYVLEGMGMAGRVKPGDGLSWHFNVVANGAVSSNVFNVDGHGDERTHVFGVTNSEDIHLENLRIWSSMCAAAIFIANRNITMKKVRLEPEGTSLAVSPRDFAWFVGTSGNILIEDVYVKGVRWDPFNIHSGLFPISDIRADRMEISVRMGKNFQKFCRNGEKIVFWLPGGPMDILMAGIHENDDGFSISFERPLPEQIRVGTYVTPGWMIVDRCVFRNVTVEGNCGTALLYQNENLYVEQCHFRNNTYDDIALGPIDSKEGCFARNVEIRNNVFESSTWVNKFGIHGGAISIANGFEPLETAAYNTNITIENNVIENCKIGISIRNATNVCIARNKMRNVETEILLADSCSNKAEY